MRTSFTHNQPETPGTYTDRFTLDSARLYVNGTVTPKIKFTFNTDFNGVTDQVGVLDAVARIEIQPKFNIWAGRLLPPSDRANLYGPYYAHHWGVYTDGVQNGHPSITNAGAPTGRDNGIVYWGDFPNKIKLSVGAFDGLSLTGDKNVLGAARIQIDFWDAETGYYLNGTYYGEKNVLAIGAATQVQSGNTASTIDVLLEKKLSGGGAVTLESEYSNYNGLGGYVGGYKSQGGYGLAAYLFPKKVAGGQFEVLGKYAIAQFTSGPAPSFRWENTEINVSYLIKQFNARTMSFFQKTRNSNAPDSWKGGVGLQIQM